MAIEKPSQLRRMRCNTSEPGLSPQSRRRTAATQQLVKDDVDKATDWSHSKAMGARKENEAKKEKATGGGITVDSSGNIDS